jgi:hypothetical protein
MSPRVVRNMKGLSQKKRPPISPAWIHPGLVTGGARSRNHKKSRLRCDTRRAHLLDRSSMYAELKIAERFHRVAMFETELNPMQELLLISYGHLYWWDVLYAVRGIQKSIPLCFPHRVGMVPMC